MPPRGAPLSGIQVLSTIEGYESLILQLYGERPFIERVTITEKRTDMRHKWTGKVKVAWKWEVTFMGQSREWLHLDRAAKWICKLAEARPEVAS